MKSKAGNDSYKVVFFNDKRIVKRFVLSCELTYEQVKNFAEKQRYNIAWYCGLFVDYKIYK